MGEVCEIFQGYGFPKNLQGQTSGEFPFYKVGDISKNVKAGFKYLELCDNFIDEIILKKLKAKLYPKGTIVFAKIGEALKLNRRAIIKTPGIVDNNAVGLKAIETYCNDMFLFYFMTTVKLGDYSKATTVPSVRKSEIEEIKFSLPKLSEQQLIVSKIEQLFSELDNGKKQLETSLQQLKVYRQSLLKWAFEGKLTNKNVKEGELPEGWKWVKLGDVAEKITDGEHFRPKTQLEGIPFLSAKDVRHYGVSFEDPLYISVETAKKAMVRCNPERDDILIVSRGATVGRMCIVNTDRKFCLLGSVILIKVKKNIKSMFINYALKSPLANQKMISISGATAQQAIYLRDIKNIEIPVPPILEQHHIIQELENKLSVCDKIEETITNSLQQAETLRQSILKKAFEGRLV